MKNKLLVALLVIIVALFVTACGNKKETLNEVKVTGPRVICVDAQKSDGMIIELIVTRKFNSNNYLNYQVSKTVQTFDSKDKYKEYADAVKESDETMELDENIDYSYSLDKKNKKITTIMVYNEDLFDYSNVPDDEKSDYLASYLITQAEDAGAKCEFIETTRNTLGLE